MGGEGAGKQLPLHESPTVDSTGLGASSSSASVLRTGAVIAGRYSLLTRLGVGGMGEVWTAQDTRLDEHIAIKFLAAGFASSPGAVDRLQREVQVARRVTHANVCRVHDIGEHEGAPFLTMEAVDGESLASTLKRLGRLPPSKVREVAVQLCEGLHAVHAQGVLHRDLKPGNVMVDGEGNVRITDFGIARRRAGETEDERVEGAAGSPAYMAPELFTGGEPSPQSDLYSLGLLLWELHTGKPFFSAATMTELLRQHRTRTEDLGGFVRNVGSDMEGVVSLCLQRRPEDRPRSALAVRAALRGDELSLALASGETPSIETIAAAGGPGALGGRRAWTLVGVFAVLLAFAVVVLGPRVGMLGFVELPSSGEILAARARDLIGGDGSVVVGLEVGSRVGGTHEAWGFDVLDQLVDAVGTEGGGGDRWSILRDPRTSGVDFWYRQSPMPIRAVANRRGVATWFDPGLDEPGMVGVRLDPMGRLRELVVVPVQLDGGSSARDVAPFDWSGYFRAAGLKEIGRFREVEPHRVPQVFADARYAWKGTYPEDGGTDGPRGVTVEAASLAGRPVAFRVIDDAWPGALAYESLQDASGFAALPVRFR